MQSLAPIGLVASDLDGMIKMWNPEDNRRNDTNEWQKITLPSGSGRRKITYYKYYFRELGVKVWESITFVKLKELYNERYYLYKVSDL